MSTPTLFIRPFFAGTVQFVQFVTVLVLLALLLASAQPAHAARKQRQVRPTESCSCTPPPKQAPPAVAWPADRLNGYFPYRKEESVKRTAGRGIDVEKALKKRRRR